MPSAWQFLLYTWISAESLNSYIALWRKIITEHTSLPLHLLPSPSWRSRRLAQRACNQLAPNKIGSRDNSVNTVNRLVAERPRVRDSIPVRGKKRFSTPQRPYRPEDHQSSYPIGTWMLFPRNNTVGTWSWIPTLVQCRGTVSLELCIHSYIRLLGVVIG
jgi:hypothetical protein